MTRTYAELPVSAIFFDEVKAKLAAAGYDHALIDDDTIDMDGLALKRIGATGDFPEGKLGDDDEGALQMAVSSDEQNVRIDFGTATKWLAFPPKTAVDLAVLLIKHATKGAAVQILVGRAAVSAAEPEKPKEEKKDGG